MKSESGRRRILWVEFAGFSLLIALAWLNEATRLPHLLFHEPLAPHWGRAAMRTAVIVGVWFLVHRETRRLLNRLHHLEEYLLVCAWCRKIGDHGQWFSMEKYFGSKFDTRTTHGMCPECAQKMVQRAQQMSPDAERSDG